MADTGGKWIPLGDYVLASGLDEEEVRAKIESGSLLSKTAVGVTYVWLDSYAGDDDGGESARYTPEETGDGDGRSDGEAVEGEALARPFSETLELAHQTERAISLVDRSLAAFMMMHKEVAEAKDRYAELSRKEFEEQEGEIELQRKRIDELENELKEKEQEIADLKMLVEILESRASRKAAGEVDVFGEERASVGDLMEDQLKYIMEDDMVKELLKE